ncbi:ATP-binding cassette subfamily C member 4 [Diabrotica virgifera virgifera]|uniref:Multidrug resistance-associated protein 4-like n=1 Tax=Diabrotica virgifera virgifera TaxID=50390 RepID=A0A6P7EYZ3_DIAVI|nr:ATP-binding cassette subfamily C member 4 [Diabrotica virgifera virgifera]
MDSTKKYVKVSPEQKANLISKLFYWWFLPFFKFGYKHDITIKDVYNTTQGDLSAALGDALQKNWEDEIRNHEDKKQKKPSLKNAILKTFWKSYSRSGIALGFQFVVIRMLQPIVLAEFINYFDSNQEAYIGWWLATGVIGMAFLNVIITHSCTLDTQRVGMRVRIAVCSLIYRKLLKLSHNSLGQTASGQLVNLLSNDVQRFDLAAQFIHYAWIMPLTAGISFYILYRYVGIIAAVTGMVFITLESLPLQGSFSKWQGKLRYKIALKTDKRVKLMSEITSGIQVIKMYAWEKPFEKVVELSRKYEIDIITTTSYCYGVLSAMGIFTERMILYITVITFVLVGQRLTGDVVFSLAQLFNTVQLIMAIFFPRALSFYSEAKVSITRLEDFLLLDENEKIPEPEKISNPDELGEIQLTNISASWASKPIAPTLMDLNLHIQPGTLCCVVGNVGCGKSSLLQLLLRELPASRGQMKINGKISYASQEPWLFVSNVKENILFGKPFLKNRYHDVVKVCSLERDFKQFPFGDRSLVGERGTSLSGGQRARINLARAVYTEADIYLFDDPLSAVDTKVARHLFDECISKYLYGKTRILVTHQLQFMKKADLIIIINNGQIEKIAKFNELSENDLNALQQEPEADDKEKEKVPETGDKIRKNSTVPHFQSMSSLASSVFSDDPNEEDELIEKGAISNATYVEYWKSGGGVLFLFFTIFIFLVAQMITNASDLWLTHWTNNEAKRYHLSDSLHNATSNKTLERPLLMSTGLSDEMSTSATLLTDSTPSADSSLLSLSQKRYLTDLIRNATLEELNDIPSTEYYIYVYTGIILASVVFLTWRSFLYYQICMTASKVLHNKMFNNVLQAPMRFFDTNPSGRILNRFSKDMGAVDELLPRCQIDAIQIFMVMIGILAMVFIVTPWMIIPAVILAPLYYFFRVVYLTSAQSLKRLEGVSRAPVFSHISASLYGITTIRASNAEKMITTEFDILQDQHTSTWYLFIVSSTAFGFYLDVMSCFFLAIVTYQFLLFRTENTLSANVGLVISQSLILTGMVQYGVRQSAEVASNMISVERVLQYTKLDKEGPFETLPGKKPPRNWPEKGRIIFKNTYLKYAPELPPVLKDLNIEVNSGEKIGIVGRTGAGKSTLIASLFRLAPIEGTISIDDVDTAEIGLNDLRLNISIIPQEPILFSASLRYNLDPFEKHGDEVLWKALEDVELKGAISDLNQVVSEGGSNFSAGQRQLICLARAIIRNNKVLVMDEATANVDPQTDGLIQKTIRERFQDCTVLTIAHRLNTIMDSDRVLVMDAGQAMEFDHPYQLLQNPEGYFSKMVQETGPAMAELLSNVAKNDYIKKKGPLTSEVPQNLAIEDNKD